LGTAISIKNTNGFFDLEHELGVKGIAHHIAWVIAHTQKKMDAHTFFLKSNVEIFFGAH
jgi:hypothetical protein